LSSYVDDVEHCGIDGSRLIEVDRDPLIGNAIDRYQVIDVLGRGAMGSVYRATHLVLRRDFALKVLFGDYASNKNLIARFHREARVLSKLRHSNIVNVVDFLTTERGLNVLIMDFLPGKTLAGVIEECKTLPPRRAAKITRQIASGLAEAHRMGIVHRDVKPSNVLIMPEGTDEVVKLVDFGVVAVAEPDDAPKLTGTGRLVGTPMYMSPEQLADTTPTPLADLYSLGVLLYEMLAGRPPFEGTSSQVLLMHVKDAPPPLASSLGLGDLAHRLLAKDPAERPQTGDEVVAEIDELVASWSQAPEVEAAGREASRPRRVASRTATPAPKPKPVAKTAIAVVLLAMMLGLIAAVVIGQVRSAAGVREEPLPPDKLPPRETVVQTMPKPVVEQAPVEREPSSNAGSTPRRGSKRGSKGGAKSPEITKLRKELGHILAERGLELDDLEYMTETERPWKRFKDASRSGRNAEAIAALQDLEPIAKVAPVTRQVLEHRLERLEKEIDEARPHIPKNLMPDIDDRYLYMRAHANADTAGERETYARRMRQLEREVKKLVSGQ
jgi:serine/threonine-protein kinase